MPMEPHEELKLAWELELMSITIDKTRLDIEESRKRFDHDMEDSRKRWDHEMEESRRRWDKHLQDREMDERRFKVQVWATVIGGLAAIGSATLAYLTWWSHLQH